MPKPRKGERLFKRGRIWYTSAYNSKGQLFVKSTRCTVKDAAREFARKFERSILDQENAPPTQSLGQAVKAYLQSKEPGNPRTFESAAYYSDHILRILGEKKDINAIKLKDAEHLASTRLKEGVEPYTADMHCRYLRIILNDARRRGFFHGEVACLSPKFVKNRYVPDARFLSLDEIRRLHRWFLENLPGRADYILAYIHIGCRRSELFRILPSHIDWTTRQVYVDGTKTPKSKRWVPLTDDAFEILDRRMREGFRRRLGNGGRGSYAVTPPGPGEPIFPAWGDCYKHLGRATKELGIYPRIEPRHFRSTFCCIMLNAGKSTKVVAELMGHGDTSMVEAIYGQITQDAKRQAIEAIPRMQA